VYFLTIAEASVGQSRWKGTVLVMALKLISGNSSRIILGVDALSLDCPMRL